MKEKSIRDKLIDNEAYFRLNEILDNETGIEVRFNDETQSKIHEKIANTLKTLLDNSSIEKLKEKGYYL